MPVVGMCWFFLLRRRVIPLLHSDAVVSEWPVIGVWVRGVQVTGSAESGFNGLDNRCANMFSTLVNLPSTLRTFECTYARVLSQILTVCLCH